ncbi:MAG TPA: hypothetical protein VHF88_01480 [Thermoleophilaceae bacterium]|nr:hypothetical protein [Thermoleophilaceae bacterium]
MVHLMRESMSTQRISPNALLAFKEALSAVFWAKKDLLAWLQSAVPDAALLDGIDWLGPDYKRDSVARFVDRLARDQSRHGELLIRLMVDIAAMEDFPRLAWTDDAERLIDEAQEAVGRLRQYMKPYEAQLVEQEVARDRIQQARADAQAQRATAGALERLKMQFFELHGMEDAQARGHLFEPLPSRLVRCLRPSTPRGISDRGRADRRWIYVGPAPLPA